MFLAARVPATNERGPLYMDQVLAALHQANPARHAMTLLLGRHAESVGLLVRVPDELAGIVQNQLYAQYPDCHIEVLDEKEPFSADVCHWAAEVTLSPEIFPLKRFVQFDDAINRTTADPLTGLLTSLARVRGDQESSSVEITVRPASARHRKRAEKCLRCLARPFFRIHPRLSHLYAHLALSPRISLRLLGWLLCRFSQSSSNEHPADSLHTSGSRQHDREDDLQAASSKLGQLLFDTHLRLIISGPAEAEPEALKKIRQLAGVFGIYHSPGLSAFHLTSIRRKDKKRWRHRSAPCLLSTEELATLWHPPTLSVRSPTLAMVESREMEPPVNLPLAGNETGLAILGRTAFRSQRSRFGIRLDDRRRHVVIEGKTGMGKSTLLYHLIASDIAAGRGVGLIDPHGDLAEAILHTIPRHRTNDVIIFDAGDRSFPLAFNVLACPRAEQRPLIASGVLSAFKKLYADSWGPRMEHVLRNSLLALIEAPGSSLLSLMRLLSDARYRKGVVEQLTDPVVKAFWENEFARMPARLKAEVIAPVQNKIGHFISSPLLRNIVGQTESRLNLREILDDGRILIANLSKGRIGDDASALLGSFLVTALQLAAMSRAEILEHERADFFLYVDEFQNFATESFTSILSEARKYRLSLCLANQYLAQIEEATLAAVFGNVGTFVAFQVGAQDAELVQEQLGGDIVEQDLLALPRYRAYVRLLIDGMPSRPFSMTTIPPTAASKQDSRQPAIIRRTSRHRFSRPLAQVEKEIRSAVGG